MSRRDHRTPDLFDAPKPAPEVACSMDYRATVAHVLAEMLRGAPGDRYDVAAQVSRLTGKDVSKYMLDAYTSEAREEFNLPAWLIGPLEVACRSHALTHWLAGIRGGRLLVGEEALMHDLARWEQKRDEADEYVRALKHRLRGRHDNETH